MSQRNYVQVIHMLSLLYKNLKNKNIHLYINTYQSRKDIAKMTLLVLWKWLINEEQIYP